MGEIENMIGAILDRYNRRWPTVFVYPTFHRRAGCPTYRYLGLNLPGI